MKYFCGELQGTAIYIMDEEGEKLFKNLICSLTRSEMEEATSK